MRKRRIGSVSFLIDEKPVTIKDNIEKSFEYIKKASELGIDILLFTEALLTQNSKEAKKAKGGIYPVEKYPGNITKMFCEKAKEYKLNILVPNYISEGNKIFNQTTIIDSEGNVIGFYRKVQPTYGEIKYVYAGSELPVFDLCGIKIATMTCLDIYFPEICRVYAMKGAEIIFWPTLTHGPTQSGLEAQYRSRAIDNSIHIVQSNIACNPPYAPYADRYQPGRSSIMDYNGDIIADTGRREGICFADIDFDEKKLTAGVIGFNDVDKTRPEMESITRMELFANEYKKIAAIQNFNKLYQRKLY